MNANGAWKLTSLRVYDVWTAGYHGDWTRIGGHTDLPFHYKNPVTGRPPAVLVP